MIVILSKLYCKKFRQKRPSGRCICLDRALGWCYFRPCLFRILISPHYSVRAAHPTETLETMARLTPRGELISLKSAVKTRSWTELTVLDNLLATKGIFAAMVTPNNAPAAVTRLNWPITKLIAHVLCPFADWVKVLEGDKYVTGDLVASSLCYLRKLIVAMMNHEDKEIAGSAKSMFEVFDQRLGTHDPVVISYFSAPGHLPAFFDIRICYRFTLPSCL